MQRVQALCSNADFLRGERGVGVGPRHRFAPDFIGGPAGMPRTCDGTAVDRDLSRAWPEQRDNPLSFDAADVRGEELDALEAVEYFHQRRVRRQAVLGRKHADAVQPGELGEPPSLRIRAEEVVERRADAGVRQAILEPDVRHEREAVG